MTFKGSFRADRYVSKAYRRVINCSIRFRVLALLLLLPAVAPQRTLASEQPMEVTPGISGYVTSMDGMDPSGFKISLYSARGNFPGAPTEIVFTDSTGYFEFNSTARPPYLLNIEGSKGAGRVWFPEGTPAAGKYISYPVTEKIVILHTNDQHFTVNNLPELKATVNGIREKYESVFLFSAGDIFVRHPMRWIINGRLMRNPEWYGERAMYMINTMNDLGYDLMTPGNHEFAYREPYTRNALDSARFPLVAANIEIKTDAVPPLNDYVVFKTSTWRNMAVLGLSRVNAGIEGIRQIDVSEIVDNYISLRDSAEIFVALTHIGLRSDYELAGKYPQFDVIVGGHSHDLLEQAEIVNTVLVAQAGGNPHIVSDDHPVYLGKIILLLENGVVKDKKGWLIEIEAEIKAEIEAEIKAESKAETKAETEVFQ